ncbi:MAG: 2'-5' RNA ligase family protein [Rhizorhabdus sp.]
MPGSANAPIIVTALMGPDDFAWADGLRRAHFPAERNQLPAHLTMFHHLPPSALDMLKRLLAMEARVAVPPAVRITRLLPLGRGVALGVESPGLSAVRSQIADAMQGLLTPQDQAAWRPHITIQNKVAPSAARALLQALSADFQPRSLSLTGFAAYWYRGGPWEPIAEYKFSRSGRPRRS